jgi:hypothetical protein
VISPSYAKAPAQNTITQYIKVLFLMAGETEPTVPSAGHRGDGETRRGTRKLMLTEKGQAHFPKPKTRRLNKDPPAIHPRKVGSRASKSYRIDDLAKGRSSRPRASQIGEMNILVRFRVVWLHHMRPAALNSLSRR